MSTVLSSRTPTPPAKTIIIERNGEVIGDLMLDVRDAWAQAEVSSLAEGVEANLGWVLHPDHTGRGYASGGGAGAPPDLLSRRGRSPCHRRLLCRQ